MSEAAPRPQVVWKRTSVRKHAAVYGEVDGRPAAAADDPDRPLVLFLHGWALGHHSYRVALGRLARNGFQVVAPALPGFGGTADLPARRFSFKGYAEWTDAFLTAIDHAGPVAAIGHSFGGAVAIQLAHDFPDRVSRLVLVNSVGPPMRGRT